MMDLHFDIAAWQWWLIAALALFLFEIFTPGFVLACFGVGCLLGLIPASLGLSVIWQVLFFVAGAVLSLIFLRPFIVRISRKRGGLDVSTGADALIGRVVQVKERIDPAAERGRVAVDGDSWRATTADSRSIEQGAMVRIVGRESLLLIVTPINEPMPRV